MNGYRGLYVLAKVICEFGDKIYVTREVDMHTLIFLALINVLIGCGRGNDPELYTYAMEFVEDASERSVDVNLDKVTSISYKSLDKHIIGRCVPGKYTDYVTVYVDPEVKDLDPKIRKSVVYHELGHCLLGLGHTDESHDIMSVYQNYDVHDLTMRWEHYVDDLFYGSD